MTLFFNGTSVAFDFRTARTLNAWLEMVHRYRHHLTDLDRCVRLGRENGLPVWRMRVQPGINSGLEKWLVRTYSSGRVAAGIDLYTLARVAVEGPKVYRPSAQDILALGEIEASLTLLEYHQPFPTLLLDIPDDVRQRWPIHSPAIHDVTGQPCSPETCYPVYIALHHAHDVVLVTMGTSHSTGMTISFSLSVPEESLEDGMADRMARAPDMTPEESAAIGYLGRVALNAAMMLTEHGRALGPANPSQYARAQRYLELARQGKGRSTVEQAEAEVRRVPQFYGFEQHIHLRTLTGPSEAVEASGDSYTVRPHWRRAHWRAQHYGPRGSLLKRVLIPHTMVNRHRFAGVDADTRVVMQ